MSIFSTTTLGDVMKHPGAIGFGPRGDPVYGPVAPYPTSAEPFRVDLSRVSVMDALPYFPGPRSQLSRPATRDQYGSVKLSTLPPWFPFALGALLLVGLSR